MNDMRHIFSDIIAFLFLLAPLAFSSCSADSLVPECGDGGGDIFRVDLSVPGMKATKSVLGGDAWESQVNDLTVAVYDAGTGILEAMDYFSGSSASLTINRSRPHRIYVLANMGDQMMNISEDEEGMQNFYFAMSSFDDMASMGIPMAGVVTTSSGTTSCTVSLRRLLAKLVVTVDRSDIGAGGDDCTAFTSGTLYVRNVYGNIFPFLPGGSAAISESDFFGGDTDYEDILLEGASAISETVVLYVPENMQGTHLAGNGNQLDKSLSNGEFSGQEESALCTYLEFDAWKNGMVDGVNGSIIYRFYPGGDATTNFDLEGGKRYDITLRLTWNGMFTEGNWMVTRGDDWEDFREIYVGPYDEDNFDTEYYMEVPPGIVDEPWRVFYDPLMMGLTEDEPYSHADYGWGFSYAAERGTAIDRITDGDGIEVGWYDSPGPWSVHSVTVPDDDALIGNQLTVEYSTPEGNAVATVYIDIVDPDFSLDTYSIVKAWNQYGSGNPMLPKYAGGNVPLRHISWRVTGTNASDIQASYNAEKGMVNAYWKTANTSTTPRQAYIIFEGLNTSCVCTVYQQGKPSWDFGGEDDGGEGDNDY